MSLSGQLKHGDVSKDIWQDSERACKEENTNNLLPPFHKVTHSSYECFRANDRIAELEAEIAAIGSDLQDEVEYTIRLRERAEKAEAALDSFLGLDGGKTVIELRAALAERDRMLNEAMNRLYRIDARFAMNLKSTWKYRVRAEEVPRAI